MLDETTIEARRLAASLRSIDADLAESAHAVLLALEPTPDQDTLMGCADTLETIEQRLPPGALAALVRLRLTRLQGLVNTMLDNDLPPTAA
ncbi:hypothetical protein ELY33_15570 [Vreelandella andesensis]|uniref:Uncharacterized protein n=1 Tax=Vreelandella andesensis TaxID=447567 RepID=A0A3S0WF88_9GAMM|nr:hypothetical protein [Halomonas andesensis]RUR27318.1 hypothetical protein ELY33_15570 [Halomonas andesensis]